MHNANSTFLNELRHLIVSHELKESNPDAMLIAAYAKHGPQVAFEFGRLVHGILKEFRHEDDAAIWQEVGQRFLSSETDKIIMGQ